MQGWDVSELNRLGMEKEGLAAGMGRARAAWSSRGS